MISLVAMSCHASLCCTEVWIIPIFCFLKILIFTLCWWNADDYIVLFSSLLIVLSEDRLSSFWLFPQSLVGKTHPHVVSVFCQQWPLVVGGHRFWQSYLEESVGWSLFEMPTLELVICTPFQQYRFIFRSSSGKQWHTLCFLLFILGIKNHTVFSCLVCQYLISFLSV